MASYRNLETALIHGGIYGDKTTGAVNVPIYQTSTYEQQGLGQNTGWEYSRTGNPTRAALEALIAELEGGTAGFAFASGLAAITTVLSLFKAGDKILISSNVYGGTFRLLDQVFRNFGIGYAIADTTDLGAFEAAITPEVKAVLVESPANPLLTVTELAAVSEIAHRHGLLSIVDNAGVKILFAAIYGIDNHGEDPEWAAYRDQRLRELYEEYAELDIHADPILEGFNVLHDKTGVKRRKNIPASENLIRLLKKNQGMFFINQAVDIYNLISLESKLALGAHNIDRVSGNVTLRFTDGNERFVPIGQTDPVPVAVHEYSYCDDANEVLCRLEIRQVEKTKVDEDTRNIFYIVQGNEATPDVLLRDTAERIINMTTRYCGGYGEIIVPERIRR